MKNNDLGYLVKKYHAQHETGLAFVRVCPKCGQYWVDREDWLFDTKEIGTEDKLVPFQIAHIPATIRIRNKIYAHRGCGGQMLDEGESSRRK